MARFTNPSTWGRSKHNKSPAPDTSTASLNQSTYRGGGGGGDAASYTGPLGGYGGGSSNNNNQTSSSAHHPYAGNPPAPLPVVAHDATDMDDACPVCLESLAFSFRLPGEKPHIVPECGHALHEACFTAVYGPVTRGPGLPRKNLGVCGVCRRPMKVGDGDGGKSNKLAALTGMGSSDERAPSFGAGTTSLPGVIVGPNRPPGLGASIGGGMGGPAGARLPNGHTPTSSNVVVLGKPGYGTVNSGMTNGSTTPSPTSALIDAHPSGGSYGVAPPVASIATKMYDPTEDDPLEHTPSMRSGSSNEPSSANSMYVVTPSIQVRSEFPTITPNVGGGANSNGNSSSLTAEGGSSAKTQPLTCIVIVELASRRTGPLPNTATTPSLSDAFPMPPGFGSGGGGGADIQHSNSVRTTPSHLNSHPEEEIAIGFGGPTLRSRQQQQQQQGGGRRPPKRQASATALAVPQSATSTITHEDQIPTVKAKGSGSRLDLDQPNPAFVAVALDLQQRIADWKGHPMSGLGNLQMFDILSVRRDALVREFFVYLFKEAIICVLEDKKKSPNRNLNSSGSDNGSPAPAFGANEGNGDESRPAKPVLRLKGRIYIRHIRRVHDTSQGGELSLSIDMEDERLESFILIFRDRTTLEGWRSVISALVDALHKTPNPSLINGAGGGLAHSKSRDKLAAAGNGAGAAAGRRSPGPPPPAPSHQQAALLSTMEEFGGGMKGSRVMSGSTATSGQSTYSGGDLDDSRSPGHRATMSSAATSASKAPSYSSYYAKNAIGEFGGMHNGGGGGHAYSGSTVTNNSGAAAYAQYRDMQSPTPTPVPHASNAQPSNSLPPLPHTAMDLILVISLPPPTASSSTAALKIRVIKNTLDFVIGSLGVRDRLSLVTFEVGVGGKVRKTPFLRIGRGLGRERLGRFVDSIAFGGARGMGGGEDEMEEDEFLIRTGKEEKTDVVTGVNHALDSVLQRKSKNPISGMLLVSDSSETTRRAQMDLVLARAEAANLPIHSFGYGRSHDPASLWLMSNHTNGTYTFVKDWYDLRGCLAGCIGGMMCIGLINMKLHMKILDSSRFRIRKVSGGPHAIVSSDGHDVDVEIGEVRYGEKKEMLVELELDHWGGANRALMDGGGAMGGGRRHANATDEFVARMGLDALSIGGDASPTLVDGMMDRMIDEVPVFEVDGSFFDPAAIKHVSRLAHPVLLTVTILPPPSSSRPASPNTEKPSDPVIVRRRMELLASDMITRALVLISRKNYEQAMKIMAETRRILNTVLQAIGSNLSSLGGTNTVRTRKELLTLSAIRALQSVLQDVQILTDAMEDNVELFAHDHRNLGAQQAMILRDQKSWSGRTAIEKLFWTSDSSIDLVQRSHDWVSIRD